MLAASTGLAAALGAAGVSGALVTIAVAGLVLLFALWWLYFLEPAGEGLAAHRSKSYLWGYGHYFIFAALAALGAGLEVAVEATGHHLEEVSAVALGYGVAVPVAVFLLLLWAVHAPIVARPVIRPAATLGATVAVLTLPLAAESFGAAAVIAGIAVVCAVLIVVTIMPGRRSAAVG